MPKQFTVPEVDGQRFELREAALLCAYSHYGPIRTGAQESAALWTAQRYIAAWITVRRFCEQQRTIYQQGSLTLLRGRLREQHYLVITESGPLGCAYEMTALGKTLAMKIRKAMPEPLAPEQFKLEKEKWLHDRRARRGFAAA